MSGSEISVYKFKGYRLDAAKRLLSGVDGQSIKLLPKAFDLLLFLAKNNERVVTKDELMSAIWPDTVVEENNLTQNISALRRAFREKPHENRFIATIPGRGYRFVAEVQRENTSEEQSSTIETTPETRVLERSAAYGTRRWFYGFAVLVAVGLILVTALVFYRESPGSQSETIHSLAVLPFKPITAESRDEAFEMGMADTLIAKLSGGEELRVRPLAAVRRFASPEQDAVEAGKQLGVEAVLDGGVQIAMGRIRISAKLIRVSDGRQLWARQFDEQLGDIFAVQDSISEKVAAALAVPLANRSRKSYTENVEAYQLFMKGKFHASRLIFPELQKGIGYYQQAIGADQGYALAYVELSNAYRAMVLTNDASPTEMMPKAKAAAEKGVELDPNLAEAWTVLAFTEFWDDWNWRSAEVHFQRALELDNRSAQTHAYYAHLLSNIGRHDEAIAEIRRAREIDPLNLLINAFEGQILCFAGRGDESVAVLQSTIDLDQNYWLAHLFLSRSYVTLKKWDDALASAAKAKEITNGNSEAVATVGFILGKSGHEGDARKIITELNEKAVGRFVPAYALAQVYLGLGERTKALDYLEKAFEQREPLTVFLKVEPKFDELRSEPRFDALMKRMNFD